MTADHGEASAAGLERPMRAEQHGEAGAIDVIRVREIDDEVLLATIQFTTEMCFQLRSVRKIDITASGHNRFVASVQ